MTPMHKKSTYEKIVDSFINYLPVIIVTGMIGIGGFLYRIDKRMTAIEYKLNEIGERKVDKLEFKVNLQAYDQIISDNSDKIKLLMDAHKLTSRGVSIGGTVK